jgi:hypothetical protein
MYLESPEVLEVLDVLQRLEQGAVLFIYEINLALRTI